MSDPRIQNVVLAILSQVETTDRRILAQKMAGYIEGLIRETRKESETALKRRNDHIEFLNRELDKLEQEAWRQYGVEHMAIAPESSIYDDREYESSVYEWCIPAERHYIRWPHIGPRLSQCPAMAKRLRWRFARRWTKMMMREFDRVFKL